MEQSSDILSRRIASIEGTVGNNRITSIELPPQIQRLITGNEYWQRAKTNRYLKLIREGHLAHLVKLAELAAAKDKPSNWFAAAASKKQWDRTLDYLAKLVEVVKTAHKVAERLGTSVSAFIYKQIWQGRNVERWADTARERGRERTKYFAWLCAREGKERPR